MCVSAGSDMELMLVKISHLRKVQDHKWSAGHMIVQHITRRVQAEGIDK